MAREKEDYFSKYDEQMLKLYGHTISRNTAKSRAAEILNNEISAVNIMDVILLARAYEIGTESRFQVNHNAKEEEDSYNNNGSNPIPTAEYEYYGLPKNQELSLRLLKQVVGFTDGERKKNIEIKIESLKATIAKETEDLNRLKEDNIKAPYRKAISNLNNTYTYYRNYLLERMKELEFQLPKDFDLKELQLLESDDSMDSYAKDLLDKYNATITILKALNPKEAPQESASYKDVIENYRALHNEPTVGGVIQNDRSMGESIINEAARILVSCVTLGFKNDYVLLKSEGKKLHGEAEGHLDKVPRP